MKKFRLWFPVFVWAGVIFWLSSVPHLKSNLELDLMLRKIAHVFEYFVFTFLLYRAFKGSFSLTAFFLFLYPALLSFLYAASDEFHQSFVAGRTSSLHDVFIDSAGIFIFYGLLQIVVLHRKKAVAP